MAVLLSALPQQERRDARIELVAQVAHRHGQAPAGRSPYPPDSVVRQEIERIADELAGAFAAAPSDQQATLWGDFAVAVNTRLGLIERTAEEAIAHFRGR
jgi:hypothetical protein